MSDSVRPHKRQPTRLHHPWDSLGKNTGVSCPFLLQCMKAKSESEVAQLCPTLPEPMDCSLPGSSVHGIFQARVLEWVAIAFSGYRGGKKQLLPYASEKSRTVVGSASAGPGYSDVMKFFSSPLGLSFSLYRYRGIFH